VEGASFRAASLGQRFELLGGHLGVQEVAGAFEQFAGGLAGQLARHLFDAGLLDLQDAVDQLFLGGGSRGRLGLRRSASRGQGEE
jgi:hypothetical protein